MSKDIQKTALRLPRNLHTAIHEAADASGRTMNAEIVYRLQRTFDEDAEFADQDGVKYLSGLSIDRAAQSLPVGTLLIPREIDKHDPRYNPDGITEQLREMRDMLENITKEMKKQKK